MACELTGEDAELYKMLKAKYAQIDAGDMPLDPNAPGAAAWQPPTLSTVPGTVSVKSKGADVDARMCAICQGTGTVQEEYNHRRLERFCTQCDGRGVTVFRNGVEIREVQTDDDRRVSPDQEQHAATGGQGSSSSKAGTKSAASIREEVNRLEDDLTAIADKLAQYQKERDEVKSGLDQQGVSSEEARLKGDLLAQLEAHVTKLSALKARKERQLQAHRQPVTIETIIANEGLD